MAATAKKSTAAQFLKFDPSKGRTAVEALVARAKKLRGGRITLSADAVAGLGQLLEDVEDRALYRSRAGEPTIPHEVVVAIHQGTHPVRAWRTHKGMTIQQLAAAAAGMPVGYLSEIETGKKPGSVAAYRALANALGTDIDMLIAE